MTALLCAWVRDRLPEYARDALDVADGARVDQHMTTCADCRAEAAVVNALAVPIALPAGLEEGVRRAVSSPASRAGRTAGVRHYALAASFVLALITGSLLWQQASPSGPQTGSGVDVDAVLALPAAADPLLHESGLHALSEEELRTLLEELES